MGKFVDLTGQKFGRLTVIERAENRGTKICWLCQCECGNTTVVRGNDLKRGAIVSCNCLRKERLGEAIGKLWEDDNYRQVRSKEISKQMKKQWEDENFKQMRSKKAKEQWENEEVRQRQSERMKQLWEDDKFRQMKIKQTTQQMKQLWEDDKFRQMHSELKPNYKGGISTISNYLRTLDISRKWCTFCQYEANYTCQLTGKHGCKLNTHHLKAFSTIVIEAHNLHDIQIKDQVKDYTQEELKLLEEYVGSCHKDNSNAVVLSEDVHMLFHKLYGKGNNTPEQYIEFKERYLAGEFKEILK